MTSDAERRLELARRAFTASLPTQWQIELASRRLMVQLSRSKRKYRRGPFVALAIGLLGALAYAADAGQAEQLFASMFHRSSPAVATQPRTIDIDPVRVEEMPPQASPELGTDGTGLDISPSPSAAPGAEADSSPSAVPEAESARGTAARSAAVRSPERHSDNRHDRHSVRPDQDTKAKRTSHDRKPSNRHQSAPYRTGQGNAKPHQSGWREVGLALAEGQMSKAEKILAAMSRRSDAPTRAKANLELARLHAERGRCKQAQAFVSKAKAELPNAPTVTRAEMAVARCLAPAAEAAAD